MNLANVPGALARGIEGAAVSGNQVSAGSRSTPAGGDIHLTINGDVNGIEDLEAKIRRLAAEYFQLQERAGNNLNRSLARGIV